MASNWAIVIGINEYRFLQPLKYAKRDAEAIRTFLVQEAKFDRVFLFTDDSPAVSGKPTEPFRANLLRVLRQIFTTPFMQNGDNFWFFFSGHGIPHNGQDYLMPLDGDPEDIENTGISTNTITNYLRSCGADNAVMILDACRSGGKKSGEGIGRQTESEARQTGVISLFSCSPDQYSYELEAIAQGAFTYALLEGLGIRGRCATVERLNQYLQHRVPELVHQQLGRVRQIPYTIAEPLNRAHLILMPQYASLTDIATLKNDAYRAQIKQEWDSAQRLWIRVNAAASGQDMEAIEALQNLVSQRHTRPTPPPPPQPAKPTKAPQPANTQPKQVQARPSSPPAISTATPRPAPSLVSQPKQPSASVVVARRQFFKWAIPAGIGVVGVTVASQFIREQPQPSSSPSQLSVTVDYSKLEEFLKAGQWKEADQETANLMLKVAKIFSEEELQINADSIRGTSIMSFPCAALVTIDELWVNNSNGRFGFSVQHKIWEEVSSPNEPNAWSNEFEEFRDRVGWSYEGHQVGYYEKLQFNVETSPVGELPWIVEVDGYADWWSFSYLMQNLVNRCIFGGEAYPF